MSTSCSPWRSRITASTIWWNNPDQGSSTARSCCRPTVRRSAGSTASPSSRSQATLYDFGEPVRLTATVHLGMGRGGHRAQGGTRRPSTPGDDDHSRLPLQQVWCREPPLGQPGVRAVLPRIDGDSASLTGLCALLSALARQPIYQHFAVTGAVDQFGNVQAVGGGVNEKIEGFFRVCKIHGLTGKQGILLPGTNAQQLNLSDEVIAAVGLASSISIRWITWKRPSNC